MLLLAPRSHPSIFLSTHIYSIAKYDVKSLKRKTTPYPFSFSMSCIFSSPPCSKNDILWRKRVPIVQREQCSYILILFLTKHNPTVHFSFACVQIQKYQYPYFLSKLAQNLPIPKNSLNSLSLSLSLDYKHLSLVINTNFQTTSLKLYTIQTLNCVTRILCLIKPYSTKPFLSTIRSFHHISSLYITTLTKMIF